MKKHPNFKDRTGETYVTKQGYKITIIECWGTSNLTVLFDTGLILYNVKYSQLKRGCLQNPYHPTVYGVGYLGQGKYNPKEDGKFIESYIAWNGILRRCYNEKERHLAPSYFNCFIYEEWKNFQVFSEWFYSKYNKEYMKGWQVDKDIKIKGNKVYSPETCSLVPQEINKLFIRNNSNRGELPIGVIRHKDKFRARIGKDRKHICLTDTPEEAFYAYKPLKEYHIKEMADKWKLFIDLEVYEAMYNWVVEITD